MTDVISGSTASLRSGAQTIDTAIHDDGDLTAMARWLAHRSGFPLSLPQGQRRRVTAPLTQEEWRKSSA